MTGWLIKRITVSDLKKAANTGSVHPGLAAVCKELFPKLALSEFQSRYVEWLAIDNHKVAQVPEINERGAEAYWIAEGPVPIATVILHFYSWRALASQICLWTERQNSENVALRLARFEELVAIRSTPRLAAEISSFWVAPEHRGRGIGKFIFSRALGIFAEFLTRGDFGFVAARGQLGRQESEAVLRYLLDNEERTNGRSTETGQVRITGLRVSIEELSRVLKLDCRHFPIYPPAVPTAILAEKAGMRFLGYFRVLSSIYGKVWGD